MPRVLIDTTTSQLYDQQDSPSQQIRDTFNLQRTRFIDDDGARPRVGLKGGERVLRIRDEPLFRHVKQVNSFGFQTPVGWSDTCCKNR